jgi:4-hydroxy-3-methylbut-2-enyl diphosphate reductase
MLSSESIEIGEMFRQAIVDRYGQDNLDSRFRAFDTICSATQDRQDAIIALLASQALDLMIVLGGYNSSNTCNLARICADRLPTYHIADPEGLLSASEIQYKPAGAAHEVTALDWLPDGPLRVGLTSGASTPDNLVERVIRRLDVLANGEDDGLEP